MSFKQYTFQGASAAGAITVTGAAVGDRVVAILGQSRGQNYYAPVVASAFESRVSVINQIQQTGTGLQDYTFLVVLETQDVAAVAAAGSAQGDAAALSEGFNVVSAADGTKGVVLPTAALGKRVEVKNAAGSTLKIYPASGAAINAVAADGAYSIATVTSVVLVATSTTQWYSIPLVAS